MEQGRNACLVDALLMVSQQVTVKVLGLTQAKAEDAFNLRAALDHFLAHTQLGILDLLHFSKFITRFSLVAFTCATVKARLILQQKRLGKRAFVVSR